MNLITNDSFFHKKYLESLEEGRKYAILVVDHLFFFKKEEGFLEDFLYTVSLYNKLMAFRKPYLLPLAFPYLCLSRKQCTITSTSLLLLYFLKYTALK